MSLWRNPSERENQTSVNLVSWQVFIVAHTLSQTEWPTSRYYNWRLNITNNEALCWTYSPVSPLLYSSHSHNLLILMLFSHPPLVFQAFVFLSCHNAEILYALLFFTIQVTLQIHFILHRFHFLTISDTKKSYNFLLLNKFHSYYIHLCIKFKYFPSHCL